MDKTPLFKVTYGRHTEYTVRVKSEGSCTDGSLLWSFSHCEGDSQAQTEEDDSIDWSEGLPLMTGKQLAAFAMWLVTSDPPGIASPHRV